MDLSAYILFCFVLSYFYFICRFNDKGIYPVISCELCYVQKPTLAFIPAIYTLNAKYVQYPELNEMK